MNYGEFAIIYDKLINEDIDYNKIAKRIFQICENYNINKKDYLDLACGTGNVAIKIANSFENSCAVDLSEDMLTIAYDKFQQNDVNCQFLCQDMSELSLGKKFDLITCVLDSTNYIVQDDDIQSYFKSVFDHLKDDGIFIFDINSYYKITQILGDNIYTYDNDDIFYLWENQLEDDIVNMFLTFFVKNKDGYRRFDEEHSEKGYTESQIEEFLSNAGLQVVGKFDGYNDTEVNDLSERILYIVKKKGSDING